MPSGTISRRPLSATRHNANVMAKRGGSMYNPGGHRGRSGENGAGNHRKSEEDKEISRQAQAQADADKLAKKRLERRSAKLAENREKLRQRFLEQKLTVSNRNVRRMESKDFSEPLALRCAKGHEFWMTGQEALDSQAQYFCPKCRTEAKSQPRADARMKFYMRCDEQGLDIVDFVNMTKACTALSRTTGETYNFWPQNVDRWGCVPKEDRRIRFVADDDNHVFVFRGPVPIVHHPFIAKLFDENPIEEWEEKLKSAAAMERFIRELQAEGDKVVNMSMNKTWQGGIEYTWGKLPITDAALGQYEDKMREKWD